MTFPDFHQRFFDFQRLSMVVVQRMKAVMNTKCIEMEFQWVVGVCSYIQLVVLFMHVSAPIEWEMSQRGNSFLVCLEKWLADRFSLKTLYFAGYFVYAIGCVVNFFVHEIAVNIAMCFTCKFSSSYSRKSFHLIGEF